MTEIKSIYWGLLGLEIGAIGFLCFTGYLLLYHTMLIICGITTWEHMARSKITYLNYLPAGTNPFSKGVFQNIIDFFDKSSLPSYNIPTY